MNISRITSNPLLTVLVVAIGFIIAFASLIPIKVEHMGTSDFFIEQVIPVPYWIGLIAIICALFVMMRYLDDNRFRIIFTASCILLLVCIRMVFTIVFTTIPAFEPDTSKYMSIIGSWSTTGVDFAQEGFYQHDYPLSFLTAFSFVKLGVPLDLFYRFAPFVIFSINSVLLYFIVSMIFPDKKKYAPMSVFLFSISSLAGWMTVHYCPDLFGTVFYFLCLFLSIRFAINGEWSLKAIGPLFVCIFLLMLSHHLNVLFFIFTLAGFALSTRFFKMPTIKGKPLAFIMIAVFTYTLWFVYGNLVYPSFFNIYNYLQGFGSAVSLVQQAPLLVNLSFLVYPALIIVLSTIAFLQILNIKTFSDIRKIRSKIRDAKCENSSMLLLFYFGSFILIAVLFVISLGLPVIQAQRILEVFLIGLFPIASVPMMPLTEGKLSKKMRILILIIFILIIIVDVHRYYASSQRRVIFAN